jgi:RNA polymerase sigma-70 factor (ECF subfamily)
MADPERMKRLEALVRAHQARLRAYVYSRLGDTGAADDIVQEAFLDALDRLDQYDPSRPALPWLLGFARNELREHLRVVERHTSAVRLEALASARLLDRDETADPDGLLSERLDALRACIRRLPPKSRDLVRMLYAEQMSCEQVAGRWRTGSGAVRVAIHRVRRALRECVERGATEVLA